MIFALPNHNSLDTTTNILSKVFHTTHKFKNTYPIQLIRLKTIQSLLKIILVIFASVQTIFTEKNNKNRN